MLTREDATDVRASRRLPHIVNRARRLRKATPPGTRREENSEPWGRVAAQLVGRGDVRTAAHLKRYSLEKVARTLRCCESRWDRLRPTSRGGSWRMASASTCADATRVAMAASRLFAWSTTLPLCTTTHLPANRARSRSETGGCVEGRKSRERIAGYRKAVCCFAAYVPGNGSSGSVSLRPAGRSVCNCRSRARNARTVRAATPPGFRGGGGARALGAWLRRPDLAFGAARHCQGEATPRQSGSTGVEPVWAPQGGLDAHSVVRNRS